MRVSFENGHGEYELQATQGYCERSTDNDYDNDNLTEYYETSDSTYQCAIACNNDETCVAFDYGPDGYCYGYK
jgi:hypothetical protein